MTNELPSYEASRTEITDHDPGLISRLRQPIGRVALAFGLFVATSAALEVADATLQNQVAYASTTFENDYPDTDATDCSSIYGIYSWCKGDPSTPHGPRGFDYRNCTDGVAYWAQKYLGVTIPGSWGNAKEWAGKATDYTVYGGTTSSIEAGDVAQDDTDTYGHVGFVTDVNKDGQGKITSIRVAEMNKAGTGDFSWDTYSTKDSSGNFKRNASGKIWDHFIDLNGSGKGLNGDVVTTQTTTAPWTGLREPSVVVDPATGRNVFFGGADNYVHQWSVQNGHWIDIKLTNLDGSAMQIAPNTSPSAIEDPNTGRNVIYSGNDGRIWQWSVQNGHWVDTPLGGSVKANTSPSAIEDPATGRNIFYDGTDSSIHQFSVQNNGWYDFKLGGLVADGSSPSAVEDPNTGRNVVYVGGDMKLHEFTVQAPGWVDTPLDHTGNDEKVEVGTSPSTVVDPQTGRNFFYTGEDNNVWQYSVQNNQWTNFKLQGGGSSTAVAKGTSPSAMEDPNTGRNVFYNGDNKQIMQWSVQGNGWYGNRLTGAGGNPNVDDYTSPGAVEDGPTGRNIMYFSNGMVYQWSVQNNTWTNFLLQP